MPTNIKLSKISKVDLRDCWKNEATDFTPWLASEENIALLADALGMNEEETEATIGMKFNWRRLDGKKESSIEYSQSFSVFDTSKQDEIFAWHKEYTEKFIGFVKPIIKKL